MSIYYTRFAILQNSLQCKKGIKKLLQYSVFVSFPFSKNLQQNL